MAKDNISKMIPVLVNDDEKETSLELLARGLDSNWPYVLSKSHIRFLYLGIGNISIKSSRSSSTPKAQAPAKE